jgi:hypothetical protein
MSRRFILLPPALPGILRVGEVEAGVRAWECIVRQSKEGAFGGSKLVRIGHRKQIDQHRNGFE